MRNGLSLSFKDTLLKLSFAHEGMNDFSCVYGFDISTDEDQDSDSGESVVIPEPSEKSSSDSEEMSQEEENTVEVKRFFYLFIHGELEWLLSYCSGVRIVNRFFDGSNWCVELEVVKYIVSYQQRYLLHHY